MKIIRADPARWRIARKTVTFTGAAGVGAVGTVAVFTVSGDVEIDLVLAKCTVDLVSAGGGSLSIGTSGNANAFTFDTTATALDANEYLETTGTPASTVPKKIQADPDQTAVLTNQNVIATVSTGDITAGAINFTCFWRPVSAGATLS